eukprot:6011951-Amphidinium_carterae.1
MRAPEDTTNFPVKAQKSKSSGDAGQLWSLQLGKGFTNSSMQHACFSARLFWSNALHEARGSAWNESCTSNFRLDLLD